MSEPVFKRLKQGLAEVIEIQTGAKPAARIHINGHAYVPEQQWQPIETAPRHSEDCVLLSLVESGERYVSVAYYESASDWGGFPDDGPGWYLYPASGNHRVIGEPTHWMPLPNPPQS